MSLADGTPLNGKLSSGFSLYFSKNSSGVIGTYGFMGFDFFFFIGVSVGSTSTSSICLSNSISSIVVPKALGSFGSGSIIFSTFSFIPFGNFPTASSICLVASCAFAVLLAILRNRAIEVLIAASERPNSTSIATPLFILFSNSLFSGFVAIILPIVSSHFASPSLDFFSIRLNMFSSLGDTAVVPIRKSAAMAVVNGLVTPTT